MCVFKYKRTHTTSCSYSLCILLKGDGFVQHRLILIAEKSAVYETFPTPLINRLEKHFVLTSSVLNEWQKEVLAEFEAWIQTFCFVQDITQ